VRVATFNLSSGRSPEDDLVREDRLVEAVKMLDADILACRRWTSARSVPVPEAVPEAGDNA